jgi:hypothetical protein
MFRQGDPRLGKLARALGPVSLLLGCSSFHPAAADEGGVSFWLPGQYASFVALQTDPGLILRVAYDHTDASASGDHEFVLAGSVRAGVTSKRDLVFVFPIYAFEGDVLGGQGALAMGWAYGTVKSAADVTLAGPKGTVLARQVEDSHAGGSDLYPTGTLKWNQGASNWLAYLAGDVPVGAYTPGRLANVGINHGAIDLGGGYTYLSPVNRHEFSATLGFTGNFKNPDTDYKNGLDTHLDWAASMFLSKTMATHLGVAGYFYEQLTGDSGSGAVLGDFKSQVTGLGGEVGHFFPVGAHAWYVLAKAYGEFDAHNRPEGWNLWLTVDVPFTSEKAKP